MVKLFCISHGNYCCVCSVMMHADCSISKKSEGDDLMAYFYGPLFIFHMQETP